MRTEGRRATGGRARGWSVVALVAATLVVLAALEALSEHPPGGSPRETQTTAAGALVPLFGLKGHVKGMYPGRHRRLIVRISNPQPRAIVVTSITVSVGRAGPGCRGSNIRVRRFRGSMPVPAGGRARVRLRVRMLSTAPDACQGARFPVLYSGEGHAA